MQQDNTPAPENKAREGRNDAYKRAMEDVASRPQHFDVQGRDYDVELVERFLDMVFHSDFNDTEEVLTWAVPRHCKPVYPIPEHELLDSIEATKVGRALYYGTATAHRDHTGTLYNRQSLFERLHVIVLDDIGTKARAEDLPEAMQSPTYIIESSEGNFQYGYVLEDPIDNIDAAKALVMLMYEAGIADAGGKMPNKLVRLPEGINGKKDRNKCDFVTRVVTMDGPRWTPQQLLDAVNVGAKWEEVEADAREATKRRMRMKGGSTPWSPTPHVRASMSGVVDPVLEWLEATDMITSENGDWVNIICPFRHNHTSGGDTAGYKPLGTGDDPTQRAFHCFHDGCADMKTREFLSWVAMLDGPNASARDEVAELVADYVYDMDNDCAWKIRNTPAPKQISMNAMRNAYPRPTVVYTADGKVKSVPEHRRWLLSESRVTVDGVKFDPSNPARLVEGEDGHLYVNQFSPPEWGEGTYDQAHVDRFLDYVEYIVPNEFERRYFLDWLAAKCQNMGFRGAAIVMVASRQGIGRSTLANMIATLIGEVNFRNEPFEKLVGDHNFNEWIEAPFIVTDETLNTGTLDKYRTYEKLKEIIDPLPKVVTVNPKYGKQRRSRVHSTFLFLSNHSNALAMTKDDRRFFVISNPDVPEEPAYFMELNEWLGQNEWPRHVYRWLNEREVDMERLLSPPDSTAGKEAMIEESLSAIDQVGSVILDNWPCEYITAKQFKHAVEMFADRIDLYDMPRYTAQINRVFSSLTYPLDKNTTVRLDGRSHRVRVITVRAGKGVAAKGASLDEEQRKYIARRLIQDSIKKAMANASERLDELGL